MHMNGFKGIFKVQLWIYKNYISGIRKEPKLKTVFISGIIIFFWFGALALLYKGLSFFGRFAIVGPALVDESIYLFFAALFIMLILSSIIVCYVTYYSSEEMDFLFSIPLDDTVIFSYRFLQSSIFSSWAFLFLGVPFIIAFALVKQVSFWFYLTIPFYFVPFIILPSALASILVLLFVKFTDYRKFKYMVTAILGTIVLSSYAYYMVNIRPDLFAQSEINYFINDLLHHLSIFKHPLFPGYWIAKSVISSSISDFGNGLFYFLTFTVTTIFCLQLNWIIAQNTFYSGWLSSRGGRNKKNYPVGRGIVNRTGRLLTFLPRFTSAMILKDIKVFIRDPGQWFQFLIYFAILGIYILNLRNLPTSASNVYYDEYWKVMITFLNLSATALVLAGLTVRFLFPLMSLEGNKIWILGLAPVTFRHLIFQKFIISLLGILMVSEFLMISTNIMLQTRLSLLLISCSLAALISIGLVGLSVGLGSIYPNFKEDNSAKIVSGFGGTLNFIIALGYVISVIFSFAVPLFAYEVRHVISEHAFYVWTIILGFISVLVTVIISTVPMILGYKNLENTEF